MGRTASQHMVQANGLRFRTLADGPADGELAVLLHGFPEGAESWSKQVDVLARAGVLAVAPDMRGYGLSDAPDAVPPSVVEHFVRSMSRPGRLTAGLNYYRANLSDPKAWAGRAAQVKVGAPTVLIWGDQDPALGRLQAETTAGYIDGDYRLQVFEGAGHWLQFERPADVGRSLIDSTTR